MHRAHPSQQGVLDQMICLQTHGKSKRQRVALGWRMSGCWMRAMAAQHLLHVKVLPKR